MPPPSIATKAEVIALEMQGAFGNRLRSWRTLADVKESGFPGFIVIRYLEAGAPWCRYGVTIPEAEKLVADFCQQGAQAEKFFFNEMGVTRKGPDRCFQGEIMRGETGYYLFYSEANLPMRAALKDHGKHATGLTALNLMRANLCPSSLEDLNALWDLWPNAVVEFTVFPPKCGAVEGRATNFGRNTVFWEVREY